MESSNFGNKNYKLFSGKFVGQDEFGNKYYQNKKGKRWIIYKEQVDASKISSECILGFIIQK